MPLFEELLPELKLGDVDNLPCSSREVDGGRATIARMYPNRDGQKGEDMGREPFVFSLEIPLFADVDSSHYPDKADALRFVLQNPPARLEYRDHEYGTMNVSIEKWNDKMEAKMRDGVVFRFKLTENDLDIAQSFREEREPSADVEGAGANLDEALAEANIEEADLVSDFDKAGVGLKYDEKPYDAGTLWISMSTRMVERINEGIQTGEQIAAEVDTIRARIQVLLTTDALLEPENATAMNVAVLLARAVTDAGDEAFRDAVQVVENVTRTTVSVFELANELYGDEQRALEIMQRNPSINPLFIAAGTTLQVALT